MDVFIVKRNSKTHRNARTPLTQSFGKGSLLVEFWLASNNETTKPTMNSLAN